MKGLSYSFLRAICALVIGLVLVMFPDQAGDYLVITIGVIFLVPSLVSIIGYFAQSTEMRRRFPIEGVGSLLFGLWLIIMPGFFADLLTLINAVERTPVGLNSATKPASRINTGTT